MKGVGSVAEAAPEWKCGGSPYRRPSQTYWKGNEGERRGREERHSEWSVECVRGYERKVLRVSIQTDIFPVRRDQTRREWKKGNRSG